MLRDDRAGGDGRRRAARNVLGEALEICSIKPMTGFFGTVAVTPAERTWAVIQSAP
jgi:uncharacterized protein (DUF2237 family)